MDAGITLEQISTRIYLLMFADDAAIFSETKITVFG